MHHKTATETWRFEPQHAKANKMTYVPSEDLGQPGHPSSLIRVFAVVFIGSSGSKASSCRQWRLLIRLGKCPGLSESLLGAQVILLVLSCESSFCLQLEGSIHKKKIPISRCRLAHHNFYSIPFYGLKFHSWWVVRGHHSTLEPCLLGCPGQGLAVITTTVGHLKI